MQQSVIPFEQNPKSFGITILIIMVMVSLTHIFAMHGLPPIQKKMVLAWSKFMGLFERDKGKRACENRAGAGLGDLDELGQGVDQGRRATDEERIVRTTSTERTRTRTWMTFMTGTTVRE